MDYNKIVTAINVTNALLVAGALAVGIYVLSRAGGPIWEAVKKIAYKVWDDVKSIASKLKFW